MSLHLIEYMVCQTDEMTQASSEDDSAYVNILNENENDTEMYYQGMLACIFTLNNCIYFNQLIVSYTLKMYIILMIVSVSLLKYERPKLLERHSNS